MVLQLHLSLCVVPQNKFQLWPVVWTVYTLYWFWDDWCLIFQIKASLLKFYLKIYAESMLNHFRHWKKSITLIKQCKIFWELKKKSDRKIKKCVWHLCMGSFRIPLTKFSTFNKGVGTIHFGWPLLLFPFYSFICSSIMRYPVFAAYFFNARSIWFGDRLFFFSFLCNIP